MGFDVVEDRTVSSLHEPSLRYGENALWRVGTFLHPSLKTDFISKYPQADAGELAFETMTLASVFEKITHSMPSSFHCFAPGWVDYGCGNGRVAYELFSLFGGSGLPLTLVDKNPNLIDKQIKNNNNVTVLGATNTSNTPAGVLSIINPVDFQQIKEAYMRFGDMVMDGGVSILHIADTDLRNEFVMKSKMIPQLTQFGKIQQDFINGSCPVSILHKRRA